jgi:anaphase-promoting complex subunit 4
MATMNPPNERQLLQQAEKILLHPIHPHLIAYCPTMDLIALVTDEENLDVYRINGQRAFGLKKKSEDVTVDALQWEFNGKSLAISWSDGSTDLLNAETGRVSHKNLMLPTQAGDGDKTDEEEAGGERQARVQCMGWGLNFINVGAVKRRTGLTMNGSKPTKIDGFGQPTTEDWDAFKDETAVEDFLQRQPDFQTLDIAPDLPDQLAMMDMETLLPKLPAIPLPPALPFMRVSQADSGAFSSQADVDSLLHSHHLKDHNSVDMFIRCSDRGTIHPSLYDSMETVDIHLPSAWNIQSTPLLHTSHPYSCSHGLLMRTTSLTSKQPHISFVPLTLNFISSAGIYLHLIASKTSQLQNLLLYITQCLQRIRTFFKHAQDLPGKFMLNISETLEEKGQGDLVTNLFHLACTGNCSPIVREWLVDELAEAGHKRWDTTVTSSLTTLLA